MGKQYTVLEFNNQTLRIIVGRQYDTHALIQHAYNLSLPQNVKISLDLYNPTVLGPYLKDIFRNLSLGNKRVIVSTAQNNLLSRVHAFPNSPAGSLDSKVDNYIKENFPKEIRGYIIDYAILGYDERGQSVRINILKQASVRSLYDSLVQADLQPIAYIPKPCSLDSAVGSAETLNLVPHGKEHPYGLIDYNGRNVSLSFFQGGHLIFDKNIESTLDVECEEFLEMISLTYLRQCRSLARRNLGFKQPEYFYLSGTVKDPLKVRELLEDRLSIPVDVIRAISTVQYTEPQPAAVLNDLNAAGCILSARSGTHNKHNYSDFFHSLTQPVLKRKRRWKLTSAVVILLILSSLFYGLTYQSRLHEAKQLLQTRQLELQQLQTAADTARMAQAEQNLLAAKEYRDKLKLTDEFITKRPRISSDQMLALIEILPPDILLKEFSGDADRVLLHCTAESRISISDYEYLLKEVSFIEEVFISKVSGEGPEENQIYTFTVDCTLGNGGMTVES